MLQNLMGQVNGSPGPRVVPGRIIPVPTSVSADLQTAIAMPYRNSEWLLNPSDAQGWKDAVAELARHSAPAIEDAIDKLGVGVESTTLGGVPVFIVTPAHIPARNTNRLLVNTHGGAYVFNPGRASLLEPAVLAATCGITVIEVDYRMPPTIPFPPPPTTPSRCGKPPWRWRRRPTSPSAAARQAAAWRSRRCCAPNRKA